MAPPLDRTWYNTLIDDDGSGTTGTIWDKAQVDGLLDAVDAALAPCAVPAGGPGSVQFNDGGVLGGHEALTYDKSQGTLHANGIQLHGNYIFGLKDQTIIAPGSADGADTKFVSLWGGGGFGTARGAMIDVTGNECGYPGAGSIVLQTGDAPGARIVVNRGITFPPVAVPSADPNTLNDYRTVSFTPWLSANAGQSGQIYNSQVGKAVKIGPLVVFTIVIDLNTRGTFTGTNAYVSGLPFPCVLVPPGAVTVHHWYFPGGPALSQVTGYIAGGESGISLSAVGGAGAQGTFGMDPALFTSGTLLFVGGHYFTPN